VGAPGHLTSRPWACDGSWRDSPPDTTLCVSTAWDLSRCHHLPCANRRVLAAVGLFSPMYGSIRVPFRISCAAKRPRPALRDVCTQTHEPSYHTSSPRELCMPVEPAIGPCVTTFSDSGWKRPADVRCMRKSARSLPDDVTPSASSVQTLTPGDMRHLEHPSHTASGPQDPRIPAEPARPSFIWI
jgi:hypothetical protein